MQKTVLDVFIDVFYYKIDISLIYQEQTGIRFEEIIESLMKITLVGGKSPHQDSPALIFCCLILNCPKIALEILETLFNCDMFG